MAARMRTSLACGMAVALMALGLGTGSAGAYPILRPVVFNDPSCSGPTSFDTAPTRRSTVVAGHEATVAEVVDGTVTMRILCIRDAALKATKDKAKELLKELSRELPFPDESIRVEQQADGSITATGFGFSESVNERDLSLEVRLADGAAEATVTIGVFSDSIRIAAFVLREPSVLFQDPLCPAAVPFPSEPKVQRPGKDGSESFLKASFEEAEDISFTSICMSDAKETASEDDARRLLLDQADLYGVQHLEVNTETADGKITLYATGLQMNKGERFAFEAVVTHQDGKWLGLLASYEPDPDNARRAADFLGRPKPAPMLKQVLTMEIGDCPWPVTFPLPPLVSPADADGTVMATAREDGSKRSFMAFCDREPVSLEQAEERIRGVFSRSLTDGYQSTVEKRGDVWIGQAAGKGRSSNKAERQAMISGPAGTLFLQASAEPGPNPDDKGTPYLTQHFRADGSVTPAKAAAPKPPVEAAVMQKAGDGSLFSHSSCLQQVSFPDTAGSEPEVTEQAGSAQASLTVGDGLISATCVQNPLIEASEDAAQMAFLGLLSKVKLDTQSIGPVENGRIIATSAGTAQVEQQAFPIRHTLLIGNGGMVVLQVLSLSDRPVTAAEQDFLRQFD